MSQAVEPSLPLPACPKPHQPSARRNADDAEVIVALGRNDFRYCRSVLLGHEGLSGHEIAVHGELSGKIWMMFVDAAVDHRDASSAAAGNPVQLRKMPLPSSRLGREQGIIGHACARRIELNRLCPGYVGIVRDLLRCGAGGARIGDEHDEAIDTDHRHRPIVDQPQPIFMRDRPCDALASASAKFIAIASAIAAAGPQMVGRYADHDQDFAVARPRRAPTAAAGA